MTPGADDLVVVGCGTVVPEGDRGASSYWVTSGESRILFDCGPGAVQAMPRLGLPWGDLTDLVITHYHVDHVGALPGLFFAFMHGLAHPRARPLHVWGPDGIGGFMRSLASTFGDFFLDPGFPVIVEEVGVDETVRLAGGAELTAHKTPHTEESVAYRLDGPDMSFGYSGDSGPTDSLGPFMSGVSGLVCECSLFDEQVGDNHLSPSRVAAIAGAAEPRTLVLTHVYPHVRLSANVVELVAQAGYAGDTIEASEGLRVALTNG